MSDSEDAQDSRSPGCSESSNSMERFRMVLSEHTKKIEYLEIAYGRSMTQHENMAEDLNEIKDTLKSIQHFLYKASKPPNHN